MQKITYCTGPVLLGVTNAPLHSYDGITVGGGGGIKCSAKT